MNKEPLICIKDCYSVGDSYPMPKGTVIHIYHVHEMKLVTGEVLSWTTSLSDSDPYIVYASHNFITLSKYRNNQISKILT